MTSLIAENRLMRKHHVRPEKPESTTETIPAMIKRTKARIQSSRLANKYSISAVTLLFAGIGGLLHY